MRDRTTLISFIVATTATLFLAPILSRSVAFAQTIATQAEQNAIEAGASTHQIARIRLSLERTMFALNQNNRDGPLKNGQTATGSASTPFSSPEFARSPPIYHVGATGFFLDYADAIVLTTKQQAILNAIKEKSIGDQASTQQRLDQEEEELWALTSIDEPDAMTVENQLREIENLRGDRRVAFIQSVGDAVRALTEHQRSILLNEGMGANDPTVKLDSTIPNSK